MDFSNTFVMLYFHYYWVFKIFSISLTCIVLYFVSFIFHLKILYTYCLDQSTCLHFLLIFLLFTIPSQISYLNSGIIFIFTTQSYLLGIMSPNFLTLSYYFAIILKIIVTLGKEFYVVSLSFIVWVYQEGHYKGLHKNEGWEQ